MANSQIVGIPPLRTAPVGDMLLLVPLQVGLRPLLCAWALVSFGFFPLVSPCTWTYMFSIAFSLILVLHSAILDYPQINVPKLDKAMSLRWFLDQTVNIYFCWIRFLGHSISKFDWSNMEFSKFDYGCEHCFWIKTVNINLLKPFSFTLHFPLFIIRLVHKSIFQIRLKLWA